MTLVRFETEYSVASTSDSETRVLHDEAGPFIGALTRLKIQRPLRRN